MKSKLPQPPLPQPPPSLEATAHSLPLVPLSPHSVPPEMPVFISANIPGSGNSLPVPSGGTDGMVGGAQLARNSVHHFPTQPVVDTPSLRVAPTLPENVWAEPKATASVLDKYPFHSEVQDDILRLMATKKHFSRAALDWVRPGYFEGDERRALAATMLDFFKDYGFPPTEGQMFTELQRRGQLSGELKENLESLVDSVYRIPPTTPDYTVEVVSEFAETQAWISAVLRAGPLIRQRKFSEMKKIMREAENIGGVLETGGTWFFEETEERSRRRNDEVHIASRIIPTGVPDLDRIIRYGGPAKGEVGIVVASTGKGKCLREDTWLSVPGGYKRLGDLIREDIGLEDLETISEGWHQFNNRPLVFDANGICREIDKFYANGNKISYSVTMRDGMSLVGSSEHPLLVVRDGIWTWITMSEIKEGDVVASLRDSKPFGLNYDNEVSNNFSLGGDWNIRKGKEKFTPLQRWPTKGSSELAEWVSLLLAEGYYNAPPTAPYRLSFTNKEDVLIDRFIYLSRELFSLNLRSVASEDGSKVVIIDSKALVRYLCLIDIPPGRSADKRVPAWIMDGGEAIRRSFVSTFFTCESHVRDDFSIEISSASSEMIEQIHLLLLSDGIYCRSFAKRGTATNGLDLERLYFRLIVMGKENLRKYKQIGFMSGSNKFFAFQKALQAPTFPKSLTNFRDKIHGAPSILRSIKKRIQEMDSTPGGRIRRGLGLSNRLGKRISNNFRASIDRNSVSYDFCLEILSGCSKIEDEKLQGLLQELRLLIRYRMIEVIDVQRTRCFTYDIEVPDSHHFIANSFVSHNSIALGQFARRGVWEGENVAIFSGEMSEEKFSDRLDAAFTGLRMNEIGNEEEFLSRMEILRTRFKKKLWIRRFPTKGASIGDLRASLESMRREGWTPGMIILDYAALVKPEVSRDQRHTEIQEILQAFRGLCIDFDAVGWTALQASRQGEKAYIIKGDHVATSWDSLGDADYIFSINMTDDEKVANQLRLYIIKNRDGDMSRITIGPLQSDYARMCFVKI